MHTLRQIWQQTCARIVKPFQSRPRPSQIPVELDREIVVVTHEIRNLAAELERLRADYEHSRAEENHKLEILDEARRETRNDEAEHLADLEQRIGELETGRTQTLGAVESLEHSLNNASTRLETMDNLVRIWKAGADDQAREFATSLSHASARQDATDGDLKALRDLSRQQLEALQASLADAANQLETTDSDIRKVEKKLELEHRLYVHTLQEVQSRVSNQDQRLNWTMMAAVFAMVLGTAAGGILIWDVQKNARILAGISADLSRLRSSMESPPLAARSTAVAEAPGSLPEVVAIPETPLTTMPMERKVTTPAPARPPVVTPAAINSRKPVNHYLIGSAFDRAREARGIIQTSRGKVAPFLKKDSDTPGNADAQKNADTRKDIDAWENTATPALVTLPSGAQYRTVKSGNGTSPTLGDQVLVNYLTITPEGKVLAETYSSGKPATLDMKSLEPRLQEALLKMTEGAEWEVYVPARLSTKGAIKARDMLASQQKIYLIELLRVVRNNSSSRSQPPR